MKNQQMKNNKKRSLKKSPLFLIALLNFLIIVLIIIYMIYLRFIPYKVITYDGYAVSGKEIVNNLLNASFDVNENLSALEVKDQDQIYQNLKAYYLGADKKKDINLDYPIYVNDSLALYNLSSNVILFTDSLKAIEGYSGFTLTSGALYNANTLQRADYYDYILMRNSDNLYINTKEINITTSTNKYKIKMNSIINFTDEFITYYTLNEGNFVYGKILDIDMDSEVKIKDTDKKYSYKEFLIGIDILEEQEEQKDKEDEKEKKENIVEENKTEEETTKENETQIEGTFENIIQDENKNPETEEPDNSDVDNNNNNNNSKWQKPVVSCTDFVPNVYTATTEISISDPSGVINKAITFSFYIDEEIAFRAAATTSGNFRVTKLLPNTKYKVIGKYEYKNKNGELIEEKIIDQDFKTRDTKNIRPIELSFKNGQIYSDRIELVDFKINSDITDEAISGVSRAEIKINSATHSISTGVLRNILAGNAVKYQIKDIIEPNTKYKYEIKFYDTANNEMKLTNNTGATHTSKAIPEAKIKVKKQDIVSIELGITLKNDDNLEISNYRYVMNNSKGKVYKKDKLSIDTDTLFFDNLESEETYTIRVYGDFDIEDGNGLIENQEIGRASFTTVALNKLGSLKLEVDYDAIKDLKHDSIQFNTKINTKKTDSRLINILKEVNIKIQDKNQQTLENINITKIEKLKDTGYLTKVENLESNTTYSIIITAKVEQGNIEEEVKTTYTLNSFTTRKKPVSANIKNVVVTTKIIDFDIMVYDKDRASIDGNYIVELRDANEKLINSKTINANTYIRYTYDDLKENEEYKLTCYATQYNETNNNKLIEANYVVLSKTYIARGLGGEIELTGLIRQNSNSKNLIDIQSQNNWYSKCFDVIETKYGKDNNNNIQFNIESNKNYGKEYDRETNTLILTSNQCYVYNLKEYTGKKVTISFETSDGSLDEIYIQNGKTLGENITGIEQITFNNETNRYEYSTSLKDGYIGFYLAQDSKKYTFSVKNLQVELGEKATDYQNYTYNLITNIQTDFIDEKNITFDGKESEDLFSKYYIKILQNNTSIYEQAYKVPSRVEDKKTSYKINETSDSTVYKIQLLIRVFDREYILDELSFEYDPEKCYEIKSISSIEEFTDIQPYGNYILLKDLNLQDANSSSEYTFGNDNIHFYGSIDFNGKTISKDLFSSKLGKDTTSYIFYNLASSARIKNIVLDVYIDNINKRYNDIDVLDGIYPLFLYNNGNIDNIIVNLEGCTEIDKRYIGLIGYNNLSTGIIENFIINLDKTLYGTQYITGGVLYSSGCIQNGYMYGQGIEAMHDFAESNTRNIAGIVYEIQNGGILQNVYSLAGITINHWGKSYSYAGNIAYTVSQGATLKNVYSLKEYTTIYENITSNKLIDSNNKEVDYGPNIVSNLGNVQFSYYFCGVNYEEATYNIKQDLTILNDYNFQDNLLNANGHNSFNVEKYVKKGYYPQLNLNVCMPKQRQIEIEMSDDNEIIDVLTSQIVELAEYNTLPENVKKRVKYEDLEKENTKLAIFNVYNPSGRTITKIDIDYINNSTVIYQNYSKKMSTVYVVLSDPTTFINEYNISSVIGQNITGNEKIVTYGVDKTLGERTIKVSFVKYIRSAEEWDNIDSDDVNGVSGLIQNYKLAVDIDFKNSQYMPSITGTFTGTMDGQGHTLSNISSEKCLFQTLNTSLKNLNVNGFKQHSNVEGRAGLIGKIEEDSTIDNVHIQNMDLKLTTTKTAIYMSGLVTEVDASINIKNSSISDITININNPESSWYHTASGMIGIWNGASDTTLNINNCYVQGIDISAKDTSKIVGLGGILARGYSETANINIKNCYTEGKITTDQPYAGGILGRIDKTNPTNISNCYSLVNITGNMENGNEYIGGIGGYIGKANSTTNNLYLGNISIKDTNISNSRRIVGNREDTKNNNNYGYKDQIINNNITSELYGATELLTYEQIFIQDTYTNKLQFGNNYNYDGLTNNILPKLYSTEGELLPYQGDLIIENKIKVISIDYEYTEDNKSAKITVKLENKNEFPIRDFIIENNDLHIEDSENWIIEKEKENNINYTTITFLVQPNKYYDTYSLIGIKYTNKNGETKTLETQINISLPFYKEIYNIDDWNTKMDTTSAENYKIMNDIDFSGVTDLKTNVSIGRLIGKDNTIKTISNLDIIINSADSGLIKEIKTGINYIKFDNVTINTNSNNVGIISELSGTMNNCEFSNITINANKRDYIGIISSCISGSAISNVNLNNIKVSGKANIGGLCGYIMSPASHFTNITGTYIQVLATGNNIGGIIGFAQASSLKNIKSYQYTETGKQEADEETKYLVSGSSNVGGCFGYVKVNSVADVETAYSSINGYGSSIGGCIGNNVNGGRFENLSTKYSNIIGKGDYVGGVLGKSTAYIKNMISENNELISGRAYVGGCVGSATIGRNTENITSRNNKNIKGTGNYVGGIFGNISSSDNTIGINNVKSENNELISGNDYVGGCIGSSNIKIKNIKTYYDNSSSSPNIIGKDYVGGIIGQQTYDTISTSISYYAIDGAYVQNANISGQNYVGGYSGDQRGTVYAVAVENCLVNAINENAGGITGRYIGSTEANDAKVTTEQYYLMHSFCKDSTVKANNIAGGLVGYFKYGNIQYCYVGNTNITAVNACAGGLAGYLDNIDMTDKQYIAKIKYNFIANPGNSVRTATSAGGLIGGIAKELYVYKNVNEQGEVTSSKYYVESNLAVTDLYSEDENVSLGIGSALGRTQSKNMDKIYGYEKSNIFIKGSGKELGLVETENKAYNLMTSEQLGSIGTYQDTEGLNFADSLGRFVFETGYFPTLRILTASNIQTYWGDKYLNVQQEKIAVPDSTGILNVSNFSMMSLMSSLPSQLPDMYSYSVDVDKINIEFSQTSPNLYFDIKTSTGDVILESQSIAEKIYTFKYDFNTPLIITVSNLDIWYTQTINKENVQNLLDINHDEYLYVQDSTIHSNKREFEGTYLNLYKGKLLSADGNIYDISTMTLLEKSENKIELLDEQIPLVKANYEGLQIHTFYHSSKVIQQDNSYLYKDQQIFIKNGIMYLADGDLDSIGNSIIIDSYNEKEYQTILGTDGRMYDLLTEINYPKGFKNENIIAMTNNIDSNNNIVLVYYSTGKVYGFNYITGEEVYDNNIGEEVSLMNYILNSFNLGDVLYETEKSNYRKAQELTEKLEYISIDEALENITEEDEEVYIQENSIIQTETDNGNLQNSEGTLTQNKDIVEKYIATYDAKTQSYVVYSTSELLTGKLEKTKSENEKINENKELISYYTNVSTSKIKLKSLGTVIFTAILLTICSGLILMYKRNNNKQNR